MATAADGQWRRRLTVAIEDGYRVFTLLLRNQIKRLKGDSVIRLRRIIFETAESLFWLSRTGGRSTARRYELNKSVQIIVSTSGERLAVLPEDEYLALLAASEDDEGDPTPEFLEELDRRRQRLAESGHSIPFDQLRSDRR